MALGDCDDDGDDNGEHASDGSHNDDNENDENDENGEKMKNKVGGEGALQHSFLLILCFMNGAGSSPPPPLKFANPSDPSAKNFDSAKTL